MAGLTVAVTGPTGEIGRAFIRSLERSREVARIVGMARRPFDPAAHGWKRTEYRRGDVLDRASVEGLVEGADVVVHLAFVVSRPAARRATSTSRARATSSRRPSRRAPSAWSTRAPSPPTASRRTSRPLTEDIPALGHARHPYSAQKAEVEEVLDEALSGGETQA